MNNETDASRPEKRPKNVAVLYGPEKQEEVRKKGEKEERKETRKQGREKKELKQNREEKEGKRKANTAQSQRHLCHVRADALRSVCHSASSQAVVSLSMGLKLQWLPEMDLWGLPKQCKISHKISISPFPVSPCPGNLCLSHSLPAWSLPLSLLPFVFSLCLCSVTTCGNYSAYFSLSQIFWLKLNVLAHILKKLIHYYLS